MSIAGFYFPGKNEIEKGNEVEKGNEDEKGNEIENLSSEIEAKLEVKDESEINDENNNTEKNENCENEDDSDEENDEEGWITPGNLEQVKKTTLNEVEQFDINEQKFKVGCMTSDFSMQNVLIQIGIPVLSVDGLIIKKPRSYAQRCITCMKLIFKFILFQFS